MRSVVAEVAPQHGLPGPRQAGPDQHDDRAERAISGEDHDLLDVDETRGVRPARGSDGLRVRLHE